MQLQRGVALVILGSQGYGATRHAVEIAARYGRFAHINSRRLSSPFAVGKLLHSEPDVLIVEDLPTTDDQLDEVKRLLTSDWYSAERKGQEPKEVTTPYVIFTTNDEAAAAEFVSKNIRRFILKATP